MIDISDFVSELEAKSEIARQQEGMPFNDVMKLWDLKPSELNDIDFSNEEIFGARVNSGDFTSSVFNASFFNGGVFDTCIFDNATFDQTRLENLIFVNCAFDRAIFENVEFKNVFFIDCAIKDPMLTDSNSDSLGECFVINDLDALENQYDSVLIKRLKVIKELITSYMPSFEVDRSLELLEPSNAWKSWGFEEASSKPNSLRAKPSFYFFNVLKEKEVSVERAKEKLKDPASSEQDSVEKIFKEVFSAEFKIDKESDY